MQRIAIIGLGKIAREQHIPAIRNDPAFVLSAAVCPEGSSWEELPIYANHRELIASMPELDAVAICTPASVRYEIARDCLNAGLHVLLEKPPTATLSEVAELEQVARTQAVTLFTAWHAQFNHAVVLAARMLRHERIASMDITWKEDVRKWHPGQRWIWNRNGFGVFDSGINALSIACCILPAELLVSEAAMSFPVNRLAPIAAQLILSSSCADGPLHARFDWSHQGDDDWTIDIRTGRGKRILLSEGGSQLEVDGAPVRVEPWTEYSEVYAQFLRLIQCRASRVDIAPLRLVADAFMLGERVAAPAFDESRADIS